MSTKLFELYHNSVVAHYQSNRFAFYYLFTIRIVQRLSGGEIDRECACVIRVNSPLLHNPHLLKIVTYYGSNPNEMSIKSSILHLHQIKTILGYLIKF